MKSCRPTIPEKEFREYSDVLIVIAGSLTDVSMRVRVVLILGVFASTGIRLAAHDFWLAATPWQPESRVTITASIGEIFPVPTDGMTLEGVERWRLYGPGGEITADHEFRRDGPMLATDVVLPGPGAYMATMTTAPRVERMKGPLFNSYLVEEGLDWALMARRAAGVSEEPAAERFARYAKVVVRNGFGSGSHLTRPVGFLVELVPMTDPTILRAGQLLTVQLLADGKAVSGAAITARPSGGGHPIMGRTDTSGHVTLPIDREGAWLVRTVHMIPGAQAKVPGVEWDSYWATLAFHTARR